MEKIELNHTIVHSKDKVASANFLSEILGLPEPKKFYHFLVVEASNGVSLDYLETEEKIQTQHYAFLVSKRKFDEIFERIKKKKLKYWADPGQTREGEINHFDGENGVYFEDPSGHLLEIITKPYGSGK